MNKRQVFFFWLIAIALGGVMIFLKNKQNQTTKSTTVRAPGETLFASFPGTAIAAVEIQGVAGNVTIIKKDGKWTVTQRDGYPAKTSYVNEFIRTLGELKVVRSVEADPQTDPEAAAHFGMDPSSADPRNHGLTACFKDATGKELAKVSLGGNIDTGAEPSPMMGGGGAGGRYIRNDADPIVIYAVSEMFPSVTAEVPRWLADDFISPEKIKSITLKQNGKNDPAWKLSRDAEEAEFKLEGAAATEALDTAAATPLKTLFSYARFEDVVPPDKVAERSETAAARTAEIETIEGLVYTVTITPTKAAAAPPPAISSPNLPPPATDNYFLTVSVTGELPKERKKAEGEKPEDAKTKDDAFTERLKTLTEKLAKEKALAGRTFEVSKSTVDALLKERAQLIAKPTPPPATDPNSGAPPPPTGAGITKPPGQATTPPIEVTTPPIEVPPAAAAPDKPATDPAKPATEPAKPETEPEKPAADPDKPAAEPAKPATETPAKPADEANKTPEPEKATEGNQAPVDHKTPEEAGKTPPDDKTPAPEKAAEGDKAPEGDNKEPAKE